MLNWKEWRETETLKMEVTFPPKRPFTFTGLRGVISIPVLIEILQYLLKHFLSFSLFYISKTWRIVHNRWGRQSRFTQEYFVLERKP